MVIQLLSGYRGKASNERYYAAGVYNASDMPMELMRYLVSAGFALRLQDEPIEPAKVTRTESAITDIKPKRTVK